MNWTWPVARIAHEQGATILTAVQSVWNMLRVGAATVLGEPAVLIGSGAASSMWIATSLDEEKVGTAPNPETKLLASTTTTVPLARAPRGPAGGVVNLLYASGAGKLRVSTCQYAPDGLNPVPY
jgi:hypothetical protein